MLQAVSDLKGLPLHATDGDIGRCQDILFDDRHWTIRYIVADTGTWIPGRRVLISPISVSPLRSGSDRLDVDLTRDQIKRAPSVAEDAPVSRQHEMELHRHDGYGYYWAGPGVWGMGPIPQALRHGMAGAVTDAGGLEGDSHLEVETRWREFYERPASWDARGV